MTMDEMRELLSSNQDLLEQFVLENTDLETIEKWMQKRAKSLNQPIKPARGKNKLTTWKVGKSSNLTKLTPGPSSTPSTRTRGPCLRR